MPIRHNPILPGQNTPNPKAKRRSGNGKQHKIQLSPAQQTALIEFQKEFRAAWPIMQEASVAAQRIFQETLDAPKWAIVDNEPDKPYEKPEMWTVGHAKINYVDHIDRRGV